MDTKGIHFIGMSAGNILHLKIQVCHLLTDPGQTKYRPCNVPGHQDGNHHRKNNGDYTGIGKKATGQKDACINRVHGGPDQNHVIIRQGSPKHKKIRIHLGIM